MQILQRLRDSLNNLRMLIGILCETIFVPRINSKIPPKNQLKEFVILSLFSVASHYL